MPASGAAARAPAGWQGALQRGERCCTAGRVLCAAGGHAAPPSHGASSGQPGPFVPSPNHTSHRLAWALVHSAERADQRRGVELAQALADHPQAPGDGEGPGLEPRDVQYLVAVGGVWAGDVLALGLWCVGGGGGKRRRRHGGQPREGVEEMARLPSSLARSTAPAVPSRRIGAVSAMPRRWASTAGGTTSRRGACSSR